MRSNPQPPSHSVASIPDGDHVVSFDPEELRNPYGPPRTVETERPAAPATRRRHSLLGIASFAIAIFAGLTAFALIVIAGVMEASTPGGMSEESVQAIVIGLGIFGVLALNLLGAGLGIAGLVVPNRSRVFGILGLIFNLLVIFGIAGLLVIGLALAA